MIKLLNIKIQLENHLNLDYKQNILKQVLKLIKLLKKNWKLLHIKRRIYLSWVSLIMYVQKHKLEIGRHQKENETYWMTIFY